VSSIDELKKRLVVTKTHLQKRKVMHWLLTRKIEPENSPIDPDVLDELIICYGWTDGIRRKLDDVLTMH
jgi:hypothetical protein